MTATDPSPGAAGPDGASPSREQEARVARATARRDNARWTGVVGFAMLFGAGFHTAFLVGGLLMAAYGAAASLYWGRRLRRLKGDPWEYDPDLDGPGAPDWSRP